MKILAIGQNYIEHNKELNSKHPSEPVVFMKPDTALLRNNKPFFIPDFTEELHYETELIIKIKIFTKIVVIFIIIISVLNQRIFSYIRK